MDEKLKKKIASMRRTNSVETAKNIKELRNERGFTTYKIAEDLKTSRSYYSQVENGKITITRKFIEKLAKYYHIPTETIVSYEKDYYSGYYEGLEAMEQIENALYNIAGVRHPKLFKCDPPYIFHCYAQLLGFEIEPVTDCETPDEMDDNDYKASVVKFKLLKGNREICEWEAEDFYRLEEFLKNSLIGIVEHSGLQVSAEGKKNRKKDLDLAFVSTENNNDVGKKIEFLKRELEKLESLYLQLKK